MLGTRIFWLGAHKVLKPTELRFLRDGGWEVFNPAYISPVYDQSQDRRVDFDQPTTLPLDIFIKLLHHDFFYTKVPEDISEILNEYFDVVIVTINADWLKSIAAAYRGHIIYRVYGQHFVLSDHMMSIGLWEPLINRDKFDIVPFARESVEREHGWFIDRCTAIVPYQIPDDVFEVSDRWRSQIHKREIATSIPNIQNPYYAEAYRSFDALYPHRIFRLYGPQRTAPPDSRIVGALERSDLLSRFSRSSGYLYNYRDDVCYLPPIEMMEIGGPVIYAPNSLLSRFYEGPTPGMILDPLDADRKIAWLLAGDRTFCDEVVAAQETVRRRYDRAIVKPIFAKVFADLLRPDRTRETPLHYANSMLSTVVTSTLSDRVRKSVYVFLHIDGLFSHLKGKVYAFEGIPRVVDLIVTALVKFSDCDVIVTCSTRSLPVMHDFFRDFLASGRLCIQTLDLINTSDENHRHNECLDLIQKINTDVNCENVVVPHYYLFPEALLLTKPIVLYLPDYFPHLMPNTVFDVSAEKDMENKRVGIAIARQARHILTNSEYTKSYLPDAGFVTPESLNRIVVAPLPLLGGDRADPLRLEEENVLIDRLAGRSFVFYPTANRPNKQIAFLLRVFALIKIRHPDMVLVLTCDLHSVPGVYQAAEAYDVLGSIVLLPRIDEGSLRWLYEHAAALCLTSTLEGNFPPQVLEALTYGTPVVATRLITIIESLGNLSEDLLLCDPINIDDFVRNLTLAIQARDEIVRRQQAVIELLRKRNTMEKFFSIFSEVLTPTSLGTGRI